MWKRIWTTNKKLFVTLGFVFCLLCTVSMGHMFWVTANASTSTAADFSLYAIAQSATQFLNRSQDPVYGNGMPTYVANKRMGVVAGLLGYQDEWEADASFTLSGTESGNTVVYYHNTLRDNIREAGGAEIPSTDGSTQFSDYGYYGFALKEMGLDEVCVGTADAGFRPIIGIVTMALYAMAASVDMFFHFVFGMLRFANPFRLFMGGASGTRTFEWGGSSNNGVWSPPGVLDGNAAFNVNGTGFGESFTDALTNSLVTGSSALVNMISDMYNMLYENIVWVIIPIFVAIALFMWLVWKKGFYETFKPLVVKIIFCVVGVPILFGVYTAALDMVYDFTALNNSTSGMVVFTTFFDFEKWAYNTRLSPEQVSRQSGRADTVSVYIDEDSGAAKLSPKAQSAIRWTVGAFNKDSYSTLLGDYDIGISIGLDPDEDDITNMIKYDTNMLAAQASAGGRSYSFGIADMMSSGADGSFLTTVTNMLQRYTTGTLVTSASYQSYVTSAMLKEAGPNANADALKSLHTEFSIAQNWRNYHDVYAVSFKYQKGDAAADASVIDSYNLTETQVKELASNRFGSNTGGPAGGSAQQQLWQSGGLEGQALSGNAAPNGYAGRAFVQSDTSDLTKFLTRPDGVGAANTVKIAHGGLSVMGMYNYLSTEFDSTKFTVYSTANTTSNQVQIGHYSVTSIGSGLMHWIYLIDALVILGSTVLIGYGYAISLLLSNFKAMFRMVPNVLAGMVGSIQGIASAIALTMALVIEIVGTCILYGIASRMIYAVYQLVELPLQVLMTTNIFGSSSLISILGDLTPVVFGLVSILLVVFMTQRMMEYRKTICQSVTEACTGMINKFLQANAKTPNLHDGMTASDMLGAAVGFGMAAQALPGVKEEVDQRLGDAKKALGQGANSSSKLASKDDASKLADEAKIGDRSKEEELLGVKKGNGTGEKTKGEDPEAAAGLDPDWDKDEDGMSDLNANLSGSGTMTADGATGGEGNMGREGAAGSTGGGTLSLNGAAGAEGASGSSDETLNEEAEAAAYVEQNRAAFEAAVGEAKGQNQAAWNEASMKDPAYRKKLAQQAANASMSTVTDTNGESMAGLKVVNSRTGEAYTQEDAANGEDFSVVDGAGRAYTDSNGVTYDSMPASSLEMDEMGNVRAINDGQGNRTAVSAVDNPQKTITDSNGNMTPGDMRVVRADDTSADYTQEDKDRGAAFTVVDGSGEVYVDSNGSRYENMDSSNLKMDSSTGQVKAIRDERGNVSTVSNGNDASKMVISNTSTGERAAGVKVVNSETGQAYTLEDQQAGKSFDVLNQDGTVYVDSQGHSYQNQSASDVSIDAATGQVNGVRAADGTVSRLSASNPDVKIADAGPADGKTTVSVTGGQRDIEMGAAQAAVAAAGTTYVAGQVSGQSIDVQADGNVSLAASPVDVQQAGTAMVDVVGTAKADVSGGATVKGTAQANVGPVQGVATGGIAAAPGTQNVQADITTVQGGPASVDTSGIQVQGADGKVNVNGTAQGGRAVATGVVRGGPVDVQATMGGPGQPATVDVSGVQSGGGTVSVTRTGFDGAAGGSVVRVDGPQPGAVVVEGGGSGQPNVVVGSHGAPTVHTMGAPQGATVHGVDGAPVYVNQGQSGGYVPGAPSTVHVTDQGGGRSGGGPTTVNVTRQGFEGGAGGSEIRIDGGDRPAPVQYVRETGGGAMPGTIHVSQGGGPASIDVQAPAPSVNVVQSPGATVSAGAPRGFDAIPVQPGPASAYAPPPPPAYAPAAQAAPAPAPAASAAPSYAPPPPPPADYGGRPGPVNWGTPTQHVTENVYVTGAQGGPAPAGPTTVQGPGSVVREHTETVLRETAAAPKEDAPAPTVERMVVNRFTDRAKAPKKPTTRDNFQGGGNGNARDPNRT